MKLKSKCIIVFCVILIVTLSFGVAFADDLDVEKCAINAIQNSSTIKAQQDTVNNDLDSCNQLQKVTNPGMILNQEKAQSTLYQDQNTLNAMTNQVRLEAYDQYNNLLKAKDNYDTQNQLLANLKQNLDSAQKKLSLGKMAAVDVKTLQINYQIEQIKLRKYQRDMQLQTIKLNYLMGKPMKQKYDNFIDYNIVPDSSDIASIDTYINNALNNRAEILNQQSKNDLQQKQYDHDIVNHPDKTDIFYATSQYNFDSAQSQLETYKISVQQDIMTAYSDLQNAINALNNANNTLANQKAVLDEDSILYKNGKMNEVDYSKAQIEYTNDLIAQKSAQRDLWMIQKKMECAVGIGPAYSGSGGTTANSQNSN